MSECEQLALPLAAGRPLQEVRWLNVHRIESWRWFGKKVLTNLIINQDGRLTVTRIQVDEISKLKDPALRYALRFAAAADAAGWIEESPHAYSGHHVSIEATDEGLDSCLVHATYSGVGKGQDSTFIRDLCRAACCARQ